MDVNKEQIYLLLLLQRLLHIWTRKFNMESWQDKFISMRNNKDGYDAAMLQEVVMQQNFILEVNR